MLCLFRVLYTYAPFAEQPKLDRTAEEMAEVLVWCTDYGYDIHDMWCLVSVFVCLCAIFPFVFFLG